MEILLFLAKGKKARGSQRGLETKVVLSSHISLVITSPVVLEIPYLHICSSNYRNADSYTLDFLYYCCYFSTLATSLEYRVKTRHKSVYFLA